MTRLPQMHTASKNQGKTFLQNYNGHKYDEDVSEGTRLLSSFFHLDDPKLYGTVNLGFIHFTDQVRSLPKYFLLLYQSFHPQLAPLFTDYLAKMVRDAQSKEDLQQKMANLIKDHEHLFRCQVGPGFEIEAAQGEIPSVNA